MRDTSNLRVCGIIMLLFILLLNITPSVAETLIEPHVDPNKLSTNIDPISIVIIYFNIFERLQGLDFNTTLKYLEELNETTIPENIRVIMNRLNDLIHSLTAFLNYSIMELDKAEKYIEEGRITEANESLANAAIYLFKANHTLTEVKKAWIEFEKNIGKMLPEDYRPRFTEYTAEIDLLFKRLNKLLFELKQKQEKLRIEVEQASIEENVEKTNTSIIVYNYSTEISPGNKLYVCGLLVDEYNNGLSYKRLKIYLYVGETELAVYSINTDENGIFCLDTILPEKYYNYREASIGENAFNATIYVMYIPSEDEEYAGSALTLQVKYYYIRSMIRIDGPSSAYPGSNISYKISIEPVVYNLQRTLLILFDGKIIENTTILGSQANIRITIPYNISVGQHFLNFTLLGAKEYSPASYRTYLIVKYIPIYVSLQYPQTYVYPLQQVFTIIGRIIDHQNNPVVNATVIALGYNTLTNESGYFNLSIPLEKINVFGGTIEFNITIEPSESWYPHINKTIRVRYVNLYIILGVALYIVLMITISSKATSLLNMFRTGPRRSFRIRPIIVGGEEPKKTDTSTSRLEGLVSGVELSHKEVKDTSSRLVTEALSQIPEEFATYSINCSSIVVKYVRLLRVLEENISSMKRGETVKEYINRIITQMPVELGKNLLIATDMVYKDCFSPRGLTRSERELLSKIIDWVMEHV